MRKRITDISIIIIVSLALLLLSGYLITLLHNKAAVITSLPETSVTAGKIYSYQIATNTNKKTKLVFDLTRAPEGMTINSSTGLIEWIPHKDQVGLHKTVVTLRDGWFKNKQEFSITVNPKRLSAISIEPPSMSLNTFSSENIKSVTAHYTDDSSQLIALSKCHFQSVNTNIAEVDKEGKVSSKNVGNTNITVSYNEEEIAISALLNILVTIPFFQTTGG
ncbi:MAG TPA: Ig domain-containing protein [Atribacterota bacterium]|nr:Ig domain-containing protein [Atribacterota bacterium]